MKKTAKDQGSQNRVGVWLVTALLEGKYDGALACLACADDYRKVANQFARSALGEKIAPEENSQRLQIRSGNEIGSIYIVAGDDNDCRWFGDFLQEKQPLLPHYRHLSLIPYAKFTA